MDIKDLFNYIANAPVSPNDSRLMVLGASESISYLNAITNMSSADICKYFLALYDQNPLFKEAIDALRLSIDNSLATPPPITSEPVNTTSSSVEAEKAIQDALAELGALYVAPSKLNKC